MDETPWVLLAIWTGAPFLLETKLSKGLELVTLAPILDPGFRTMELCSHSVQMLAWRWTHMIRPLLHSCFFPVNFGGVEVNIVLEDLVFPLWPCSLAVKALMITAGADLDPDVWISAAAWSCSKRSFVWRNRSTGLD